MTTSKTDTKLVSVTYDSDFDSDHKEDRFIIQVDTDDEYTYTYDEYTESEEEEEFDKIVKDITSQVEQSKITEVEEEKEVEEIDKSTDEAKINPKDICKLLKRLDPGTLQQCLAEVEKSKKVCKPKQKEVSAEIKLRYKHKSIDTISQLGKKALEFEKKHKKQKGSNEQTWEDLCQRQFGVSAATIKLYIIIHKLIDDCPKYIHYKGRYMNLAHRPTKLREYYPQYLKNGYHIDL